jgi:hypothetical protein
MQTAPISNGSILSVLALIKQIYTQHPTPGKPIGHTVVVSLSANGPLPQPSGVAAGQL